MTRRFCRNGYIAKAPAVPALSDKVVLNIVDGLQACYDGGPGANPKFIYDSNVLLLGTDPVAVAHDIIVKERMGRGTQTVDNRGRRAAFLEIGEGLGLGVAARERIENAQFLMLMEVAETSSFPFFSVPMSVDGP